MDTEIKNAINAADKEAQYDEKAKRLLSNKSILCEAKTASHNQIDGAKSAPFMRIQVRDSHKLYWHIFW